jgi:dihydroxyacid dehydratase/phosphogluconate dehydratase
MGAAGDLPGAGLGACNTMGTAPTMAIMAETLGMTLPGSAVLASGSPRQEVLAEEAGRRIVDLVSDDVRPSSLLTPSGFERAMTVLAAVGGSTNAIIHLCAVAGRCRLSLPLREFAEVAARVQVIADVAPVGTGLMDDLARTGGVPAVLAALAGEPARWPLGSLDSPVTSLPAFMVVRGNLAPDGAVIKAAAASPSLLRHRGPAVVFHSYEEMRARVDDPALDVSRDSVLVLAGCGPVGMAVPEWGNIPILAKLLSQGVTDMVRITDGRMSGTGFGTVVLHVAPESAVGGPLSRLRDGDVVSLDAYTGSLSVDADLSEREPVLPPVHDRRGGQCCTGCMSCRRRRGATTTSCRPGHRTSWPSRSRSSAGRRVELVITRQECAGMVVGGPTTVLDLGGLRVVSDPTFDAPGPHGYLTKTAGPAVEPSSGRSTWCWSATTIIRTTSTTGVGPWPSRPRWY